MFARVFLALCVCLISYFGYHAVHGDYGLKSRAALKAQISRLNLDLTHLSERRQLLDRNVALVRPDQIDPDMLDEEVRRLLNFARPDEIIVMQPLDE